MEKEQFITLKAVIFADPDSEVWIAQGLDYDICAQARTIEGVLEAFDKTLTATAFTSIELGREPFEGLKKAPDRFWDMYKKAADLPVRHPKLVPVPGMVPVRLVERMAEYVM